MPSFRFITIRDGEEIIRLKCFFFLIDLSIMVENSYKLKKKSLIKEALNKIFILPEYIELYNNGFKRSKRSLINEWAAHNLLYKIGYKTDRTKDVDLNQNESFLKKFLYSILSMFHR